MSAAQQARTHLILGKLVLATAVIFLSIVLVTLVRDQISPLVSVGNVTITAGHGVILLQRVRPAVAKSSPVIIADDGPYSNIANFQALNAWETGLPRKRWKVAGIGYEVAYGVNRSGNVWIAKDVHAISIAFEYPIVLVAALGVFGLLAYRKASRALGRAVEGLCLNCGYDLRATPDRCPECGMLSKKAGS